MLWIVLAGVVVGLLCFAGTRTQASGRELGKGEGHAGSARYRNRGSRGRKDKTRSS